MRSANPIRGQRVSIGYALVNLDQCIAGRKVTIQSSRPDSGVFGDVIQG